MQASDFSTTSEAMSTSSSADFESLLPVVPPPAAAAAAVSSFEHILHPVFVRFFSQDNDSYKEFPLDEKHLQYFQLNSIAQENIIGFGQPCKTGISKSERQIISVENIAPGTLFNSRHDLLVSGIHQQPHSGVHHRDGKVHSLLLGDYNGGQILDNGNTVEYEFCGGRYSESGHEDMNTAANIAIMNALTYGNGDYTVRFIRKLGDHSFRYEGMYRMVKKLEKVTETGRGLFLIQRVKPSSELDEQQKQNIWKLNIPSYYWHGRLCLSCDAFIPAGSKLTAHNCASLPQPLSPYSLYPLQRDNPNACVYYNPTFVPRRRASAYVEKYSVLHLFFFFH